MRRLVLLTYIGLTLASLTGCHLCHKKQLAAVSYSGLRIMRLRGIDRRGSWAQQRCDRGATRRHPRPCWQWCGFWNARPLKSQAVRLARSFVSWCVP